MRCYCGHFFRQMGDSTSPTVPDSKRLVVLEECGGTREHIGWFNAESGYWFCLDQERLNGDKMPDGQWCSITIGNITGWREILRHDTPVQPPPAPSDTPETDAIFERFAGLVLPRPHHAESHDQVELRYAVEALERERDEWKAYGLAVMRERDEAITARKASREESLEMIENASKRERAAKRERDEARRNEAAMRRIAAACQCPAKDADIAILNSERDSLVNQLAEVREERDEARRERDEAQRIAIKARGIIVGLEKNVTTAAVKLVEFWETQGGGNGVMARALEDALIREVNAYKKTPDFTHSSQNVHGQTTLTAPKP